MGVKAAQGLRELYAATRGLAKGDVREVAVLGPGLEKGLGGRRVQVSEVEFVVRGLVRERVTRVQN